MSTGKKIKKYIQDHGLRADWFAKKVGLSPARLSQITSETVWPVPMRCWQKMCKATEGAVTPADILRDKFHNQNFIEIEWCAEEECAKVRFR